MYSTFNCFKTEFKNCNTSILPVDISTDGFRKVSKIYNFFTLHCQLIKKNQVRRRPRTLKVLTFELFS